MAVSGLLAILDDVGSMLDDGSNLEQLATEKAAKIAEDDITGNVRKNQKLDTRHEISVVLAIAKGALKTKMLYFIPTTFAIAVFAPWAVAPLCVGSGAYIAFEGIKKMAARHDPHAFENRRQELLKARQGGKETLLRYERERIAQAIKTDAALSLELTGFQLGMVAGAPLLTKLAVLGMTSVGATMLLYTTIIGIIAMNEVARTLASSKGDGWRQQQQRKIGKTMMKLSTPIIKAISVAGMTALFFVGGHLLSAYIPGAEHAFKAVADAVTENGFAQKLIEVAATLATGVAGGLAAYGGAKVLSKPVHALREKTSAAYTKVKGRTAGLRQSLKNARVWVFGELPSNDKGAVAEAKEPQALPAKPVAEVPEAAEKAAQVAVNPHPVPGRLWQAFTLNADYEKTALPPAPVPPAPAVHPPKPPTP